MPNLSGLKERLERLPQFKDEMKLTANFGNYTQKIAEAKDKLSSAYQDMVYITKVFPDAECEMKIISLMKDSVKQAKNLYQSIDENPHIVQNKSTEKIVLKLRENSKSAGSICCNIWSREVTGIVTKWEKLASVIQDLGAKGGQEFKDAVESLKNQRIPQNDNEVHQIKNAKNELKKGVANLGLEGPFGKFLEETAENKGASPRDLLRTEIKEKINEFNLWDSFKVRLG